MLRLIGDDVFYFPYGESEVHIGTIHDLQCVDDVIVFQHNGSIICIPYDAENVKAQSTNEVFLICKELHVDDVPVVTEPTTPIPSVEERITALESAMFTMVQSYVAKGYIEQEEADMILATP